MVFVIQALQSVLTRLFNNLLCGRLPTSEWEAFRAIALRRGDRDDLLAYELGAKYTLRLGLTVDPAEHKCLHDTDGE